MSKSTLTPQPSAARRGAPATPEHKRFDQLVKRIEKARATLAAWQEQAPLFAQAHAQRVAPLAAELTAARRTLALRLEAMSTEPGWTKVEKRTLATLVCDIAGALIDAGLDDEAGTMKALFDRHAEVDYDTENRQQLQAMKNLFETVSGVDLGDDELTSEEEILRRAHERIAAAAEAEAEAPPPRRRASVAETRREAEAKAATQSLREVFRKLASALHPDRAADAAEREHRTALMQRVNQAYDAGDLLSLLSLQLEIEQVDGDHLADAPPQRIRHFNKVLAEQLDELQAEIEVRQHSFCIDFGLLPNARLNPQKLAPLLDEERSALRAELAAVQRDQAAVAERVSAKRWLKRQRQRLRDEFFDDDLPF